MKFILLLFCVVLFGDNVLFSNKDIKFQEYLVYENLQDAQLDKKLNCNKFDKSLLLSQKYVATRYIIKNTPICDKDVEIAKNHKVKFDFGNIIIEKDGELLGETDKYVKIKNPDGTTIKIDKNGQ